MNALDGVFLLILAIFAVRGLVRGFFRETFGLIGLVLGVLLAIRWLDSVAGFLSRFVSLGPSILAILAFVLVFVTVAVGFRLLAAIFRGLFRMGSLGWVDRSAGGVVGLLKGAILAGAVAFVVSLVPFPAKHWSLREGSTLYPAFRKVLPASFDLVRLVWPGTQRFTQELGQTFRGKWPAGQVDSLLRNYGWSKARDGRKHE
ncbi:MAG: CvpA family protein [candidate division KSB1 bacterium]|nr:CvpA family protein [candidate division KSB1 bacterium]